MSLRLLAGAEHWTARQVRLTGCYEHASPCVAVFLVPPDPCPVPLGSPELSSSFIATSHRAAEVYLISEGSLLARAPLDEHLDSWLGPNGHSVKVHSIESNHKHAHLIFLIALMV